MGSHAEGMRAEANGRVRLWRRSRPTRLLGTGTAVLTGMDCAQERCAREREMTYYTFGGLAGGTKGNPALPGVTALEGRSVPVTARVSDTRGS